MKLPRLLLCLFAAIALAMPPLAVRAAAPATGPAEMDCPHHMPPDQHGDAHHDSSKQAAQSCCPSAPFGWAVMSPGMAAPPLVAVDRAPRASFALHGFISAKDPPPPRV
jgi:hypothetical protein